MTDDDIEGIMDLITDDYFYDAFMGYDTDEAENKIRQKLKEIQSKCACEKKTIEESINSIKMLEFWRIHGI